MTAYHQYNKKRKEKIFFRLEFSKSVGWGHLKRCISLSKALSKSFETVFIISNNEPGALDLIKESNIKIIKVKSEQKYASEVDHYPLDLKYIIVDLSHVENIKRPKEILRYLEVLYNKGICIVLIDGVGSEAICSYELPPLKAIVQPYFAIGNQKKPSSEFWIFGKRYVIVEDIYKNSYKERSKIKVNRLLITMGGSDSENISEKILSDFINKDIVIKMDDIKIKLVVGPYFSENYANRLKILARNFTNIDILEKPKSLKVYFQWADLCLGASGTSRYEAMACGVPMIFTSIYEHHQTFSEEYSKLGTSQHLGFYKNIKFGQWTDSVVNLKKNINEYKIMVKKIKTELDFVNGTDNLAKFLSKSVIGI